jgi:hypothetical protein
MDQTMRVDDCSKNVARPHWYSTHLEQSSFFATSKTRYGQRIGSEYRFPEWQPQYEAAISAINIEKLKVITAALEDTISHAAKR